MNILCIATLDKFSRFYLDIKKELTTKTNVNLKIYSIYFSGFLYTLLHLNFSCWISVKAWFLAHRKKRLYTSSIKASNHYKGIAYNKHIAFHQQLQKGILVKSLQLQALAYIDIFNSIFTKTKTEYLVCIGDSRLCIEIAIAVAKQRGITIYYIEQGPFGTTFFDNKGVNANISIRNTVNTTHKFNRDIELQCNQKKYRRLLLYRGLDLLLMTCFERSLLYPPDLKYTDLNPYKSKNKKSEGATLSVKKPMALLILQVPLDVNMVYHSPFYKSHVELLKSIHANLPPTIQLIVREHPLYINKYESEMYNFIKEHHIPIDNSTTLDNALDIAKMVIVNNSTVGIESILKYKPTVVLGDAFYDNASICLKLKAKNQLKSILHNALDYKPNKNEIDTFKQLLFNTVLLEGAITDKYLKSSKSIANYLLTN